MIESNTLAIYQIRNSVSSTIELSEWFLQQNLKSIDFSI